MNIQHQNQMFFIEEHGERIAELTYVEVDDETINANHTYVRPSHEGQGIAKKLFLAMVEYARDNELKVIGSCSYIDYQLHKSDEYQDLLVNK